MPRMDTERYFEERYVELYHVMLRIDTQQLFSVTAQRQRETESDIKKRAAFLGRPPDCAAYAFRKWMREISGILRINNDSLLWWYRGIKKWHDKRINEGLSFPFEDHHEKTLRYLKTHPKSCRMNRPQPVDAGGCGTEIRIVARERARVQTINHQTRGGPKESPLSKLKGGQKCRE